MTNNKSYDVNMNYKAMRNYVLNTQYSSFGGKVGLFIGLCSIMFFTGTLGNDNIAPNYKALLLVIFLVTIIVNPLMLSFKAYKQVKLSPSYKKPLNYTFTDEGVAVKQGDLSEEIKWKNVYKLVKTKRILAIYTNRIHAFVLPIEELNNDDAKIAAKLVQNTEKFNPILSRNLKELKSGKGVKRIK